MDILIKLADFVSVITGLDPDKVILARANYLQADFNDDIALVDFLSSPAIARSDNYNGTTEQLTYRTYYKATFTVDFFGTNAHTNINKFAARLGSQEASEFKRDNDFEVFFNNNILNVKNIQGKTVYNRFQLEIMLKYSEEFTDDVLRIDTAQIVVNTNESKQVEVKTK